MSKRRWLWLGVGLAVVLIAVVGRGIVVEKLALKRGADAYLVGYPLVTMQATRDALVQPPGNLNTFSHARYLPDGESSVQVVAPSRDTYYSSAWLDLTDGPVIIGQPDMGKTFWLMPVLDAWTNVIADPGTRTLGNQPHRIAIVGPDWAGAEPEDAVVYRSPSNLAWAILRIRADDNIADLQDGFSITTPSGPTTATVFDRPTGNRNVKAEVDGLSGEEFFTRLAQAVPTLPLEPEAEKILARAGVTADGFDLPSGAAARGIADVPSRVQAGMTEAIDSGEGSTTINGWRVPPMILGAYGQEFPTRAVVAREGLGANLPADAVYASTTVDSTGEALDGANTYTIDVPADVPAKAFWSISIYDDEGNFLPGNTEGLSVSGEPGNEALTVTVSSTTTDGPWLRSPDSGPFRLLMRLYWPEQSVLDNQWEYPSVTEVG